MVTIDQILDICGIKDIYRTPKGYYHCKVNFYYPATRHSAFSQRKWNKLVGLFSSRLLPPVFSLDYGPEPKFIYELNTLEFHRNSIGMISLYLINTSCTTLAVPIIGEDKPKNNYLQKLCIDRDECLDICANNNKSMFDDTTPIEQWVAHSSYTLQEYIDFINIAKMYYNMISPYNQRIQWPS